MFAMGTSVDGASVFAEGTSVAGASTFADGTSVAGASTFADGTSVASAATFLLARVLVEEEGSGRDGSSSKASPAIAGEAFTTPPLFK